MRTRFLKVQCTMSAVWGSRASRPRRQAEIPGQIDLFSEFDEAERVATEEESDNGNEGDGDAQ